MNIQHSDARGSRTFIFSVIEKKKENKNRTQKAESKAIGNKQTKNKKNLLYISVSVRTTCTH